MARASDLALEVQTVQRVAVVAKVDVAAFSDKSEALEEEVGRAAVQSGMRTRNQWMTLDSRTANSNPAAHTLGGGAGGDGG